MRLRDCSDRTKSIQFPGRNPEASREVAPIWMRSSLPLRRLLPLAGSLVLWCVSNRAPIPSLAKLRLRLSHRVDVRQQPHRFRPEDPRIHELEVRRNAWLERHEWDDVTFNIDP